jgi:hypothetical protein
MNDFLTQLDERRARQLCAKIRTALEDAGNLLCQLYRGRGWAAIGYASWTECCRDEFDKSASWASKQAKLLGKADKLGDGGFPSNSPSCQSSPPRSVVLNEEPIEVASVAATEAEAEGQGSDAAGETTDPLADEFLEDSRPHRVPISQSDPAWEAIAVEAEEIAQDIGNHARMGDFVESIAEQVSRQPAVAAARLENLASVVRRQ